MKSALWRFIRAYNAFWLLSNPYHPPSFLKVLFLVTFMSFCLFCFVTQCIQPRCLCDHRAKLANEPGSLMDVYTTESNDFSPHPRPQDPLEANSSVRETWAPWAPPQLLMTADRPSLVQAHCGSHSSRDQDCNGFVMFRRQHSVALSCIFRLLHSFHILSKGCVPWALEGIAKMSCLGLSAQQALILSSLTCSKSQLFVAKRSFLV